MKKIKLSFVLIMLALALLAVLLPCWVNGLRQTVGDCEPEHSETAKGCGYCPTAF